MNKSKLALVVALGMSFSAMAIAPVIAEDAPPAGAKVEAKDGKSCAGGKCHKGRRHGGGFMSGLNLTEDQQTKIKALKTASFEANGPKFKEMRTLRQQLREGLTKSDINKSELLAVQSKINSLQADLANTRVSFMADFHSVLTEDQRQKMQTAMQERGRHGKFHRRGHHGGGPKRFGADGPKGDSPSPEAPKN